MAARKTATEIGMDCFKVRVVGSDYDYAVRTLNAESMLFDAHTVDIGVRKDGVESYVEADWLKRLARLVRGHQKPLARR